MSSPLEKIGAYARLLRLSNAPTAVADVWMGYAVVMGTLEPTASLLLASFASLGFYHGGMALNDAFDHERDAVENRGRPIAQGTIKWSAVFRCGLFLLCLGMVLSSFSNLRFGPGLGFGLAIAVFAYNSRLKSTVAGPLLMALCRVLNVYLGVVAADQATTFGDRPEYAFKGVFFYVLGITIFARDEGVGGKQDLRIGGLAFSAAGVFLFAFWPRLYLDAAAGSVPALASTTTWWLIWAVVAAYSLRGMVAAILQPTPRNIGRGVGIAIQGLIVIDATLAALYAGPVAGLAIFALLPVTMLLSKWIPQT